ncbi:uncharacterized protein LOC118750117 [Rhagoletis pomonella]|uniref:uncharacterized protein LOC118750117 n=1 Tax=Rhagoletis pomonella TaxID=28610 RepID=UPI0017848212|nr:uncharacterized protein LOC118750117 [Rhagoletis pomonella]
MLDAPQIDKSKSPKMSDDEKTQGTSTESQRSTRTSGKSTSKKSKQSFASIKFISETDNFMDYCTRFKSTPIQDNTESSLKIKDNNCDNFWNRVQISYDTVLETEDQDLPEDFKSAAYNKYRSCLIMYEDTKAQIGDQLLLLKQRSDPIPHAGTSQPKEETGFGLKVPPCDTEIFYGGYEQWPSFRDMFTAVYINHPKLSQAQKLYHLRYKTKGQAGSIVKQFALNDDNFNLAWEALKSRYENERVLVDNQITILMNLPKIQKETSEEFMKLQSTVSNCLSVLATQNIPTDSWDPILVNVCAATLPEKSLLLWEQSLSSRKKCPTWQQMKDFLTTQYEIAERVDTKITKAKNTQNDLHRSFIKPQASNHNSHNRSFNRSQTFMNENKHTSCEFCKGGHSLRSCEKFKKLTTTERYNVVRNNRLCTNCFSHSHIQKDCESKFNCVYCQKRHHSMLHINNFTPQNSSNSQRATGLVATARPEHPENLENETEKPCCSKTANIQALHSENESKILLPTAIVSIEHRGELFKLRALIDQGSQRSFISSKVQNRLKLPTTNSNFEISGMGGRVIQNSNKICSLTLISPNADVRIEAHAIVLPQLTNMLPSYKVNGKDRQKFAHLKLADPNCHTPAQVDILLGSDLIPQIMLEGIEKISNTQLAQNTIFGWILSGQIKEKISVFTTQVEDISNEHLNSQLRRFWELEELPPMQVITPEDKYCEDYYKATTTRSKNGRYVVRLPFKPQFPDTLALGHSRTSALQQFLSMEKNLLKKGELKTSYDNVLEEYLQLNHMEVVESYEKITKGKYTSFYLPHHAVIKPEKLTTKVRVVFNASKCTSSGNSLNDVLYTGPTLQPDLMLLILNWRMFKYVFNGDVEKMYRQILVHKNDQDFQRIIFRNSPSSPIRDYKLKTVTFGFNTDDDTICVDSKVKFWLEKSITSSTTPDSFGKSDQSKSLLTPASPKPVDDSLTFEAEFDEIISVALKAELKRDYSDWNAVIDKWHKTHNLRRRDLMTYDAFKIDINILYPGKELMLPSKWEAFKTKIEVYYRENLHSKKLLADLHLAENCDYILTTLLPFILPPTSWYKSTLDVAKKKITLLDAQESFVFRLYSINDYEQGVNAFDITSFFV